MKETQPTARTIATAFLLLTAWVTVNIAWGLTGPPTMVSAWLASIGPLGNLLIAGEVILLAFVVVAAWRRDKAFLALALMIAAYAVGETVSRVALRAVNPANTFFHRSFLLIPAIPMLVVALRFSSRPYPLKLGNWKARCNVAMLSRQDWVTAMRGALLYFALPALLLFQAGVRFEPVKTGQLWAWLPTILGLSALNGFAEELLFRGLMMIPLVEFLGLRKGLWFQAAFFGLHHWGASPAAIAGLPVAVILTLLGALFGRSTLETGGLAWAVVFHAALDVASLSAQLPMAN